MTGNLFTNIGHPLSIAFSPLVDHCRDDCIGVIAFDCGKATACFTAAICCVQPSRFARGAQCLQAHSFCGRSPANRSQAAYAVFTCSQVSKEILRRTLISIIVSAKAKAAQSHLCVLADSLAAFAALGRIGLRSNIRHSAGLVNTRPITLPDSSLTMVTK